ncbi:MAG: ABC transporter substrate-binding protein [Rhizobiaceae bacterium]|nr:ABC transporter substrate-binding protein [Rhizobiaceae bacterium]
MKKYSAVLGCLLTLSAGHALAQDDNRPVLKMAVLEALSGPNSLVAKHIANATRYTVETEMAKPDYKGPKIELKEYDTQGLSNLVSDRLRQAIDEGANVIVQGNSSALAAQVSEAIARHNARNPEHTVLFLNTVAAAMELTGAKCQFYHFRGSPDVSSVIKAIVIGMKDAGALGTKVYALNQNYSFGQDINKAVNEYAGIGGYTVVGETLHEVQKIQDFAPYVAAIASKSPDSVITGNYGNDLLLFLRASREAGQKYALGAFQLDAPGTLAAAGPSAEGGFAVNTFNAELDADSAALAEDYKAKIGEYPVMVAPKTVKSLQLFFQALNSLAGKDKVTAEDMVIALENTKMQTSIGEISYRKEDHQIITPVVVSKVSKDAKYKADGTDMGFKPVKVIPGSEAISAVQDNCKMERPKGL